MNAQNWYIACRVDGIVNYAHGGSYMAMRIHLSHLQSVQRKCIYIMETVIHLFHQNKISPEQKKSWNTYLIFSIKLSNNLFLYKLELL